MYRKAHALCSESDSIQLELAIRSLNRAPEYKYIPRIPEPKPIIFSDIASKVPLPELPREN